MKILKVGSTEPKTFKKKCKECKTLFEYTGSDIESDFREGGTSLTCPHCGAFIVLTSGDYSYNVDRRTEC